MYLLEEWRTRTHTHTHTHTHTTYIAVTHKKYLISIHIIIFNGEMKKCQYFLMADSICHFSLS